MKNEINKTSSVSSHPPADYSAKPNRNAEDQVIRHALTILSSRVQKGDVLNSPQQTKDYLALQLSDMKQELFCALWLNSKNQVMEFQTLFAGTIDGAPVYPREVVREAIRINAAAVIFAHNHPSGYAEPSNADKKITVRLSEALGLIDVRTLDHIIIGGASSVSLAERGII
jgi:DNA repair protein RadC